MTRVYVPATIALLAEWHAAGAVPAVADRVVASREDEDIEYHALMEAAVTSAGMQPDGGRRVVVVAEVGHGELLLEVPLDKVVAVHCDTEDRSGDADPHQDLGWYATQEIPDLI
ncbi:DUF6912 family protein [Nocardioides coralli]|uniref:DUF6912 family protein n=1 Tax=Nocardioides coralli TaxID=2872154 RepID=UPI001CA42543|nr:hypothetical protein [Nocardioides coralli]QZY28451.1 hypothetical protein K6T13_13390 [Nocardioides coralli]